MTPDHERPAESVEPSRERQLAGCLRRLLDTTELNMDDMEEETRVAVREALCVLDAAPTMHLDRSADAAPETIACAECDVDSPPSLAAALQEGWTRLQRDDGPGWNYLGVCPECQARENVVPESEPAEAKE